MRTERDPALATISSTNAYILERIAETSGNIIGAAVERQGHTDLVIDGRKFSGNAQRRKGKAVLFHGSFLLGFDLDLIEELLPMPTYQPEYRAGRSHGDFLMNLGLPAEALCEALRTEWSADSVYGSLPLDAVRSLAETRYLNHDWTYRF